MSNDIVQRLMAFEACHANEDAEMALDAAKEITSLRASQSRHAAELARIQDALDTRNAQMRNIGNALNPHAKSMLWDNIADGAVERITGHAAELERVKAKGAEHYNAAINLDADLAKCKAEREALVKKASDTAYLLMTKGGSGNRGPAHVRDAILALLDSGSQG
jgi:chromosome segregation ATPase